jgi:tetratricopeptide (TPR) repeat protein
MDSELPPPLDQVPGLCEQGRLAEAEAICRTVLQGAPRNAEALHLLGLVALQRGDPDGAARLIGEAVAVSPDVARYQNNLAAVLNQTGRFDDALRILLQAVALHPHYADAYNNLGNTFVHLRRLEEALASYDRAIALRPDYDEALYNRGVALQSLERYEAAAESYRQTIKLHPDYLEAYNNLGIVLVALERAQEALAAYDQAIALDPEYDEALYNRGIALQTIERHDAAVASYDAAIALRPDYADAIKNRAMMYQALGRYDEALADFDRAIALRPSHAPTHFSRSCCLLQSGDMANGWKGYEWRWRTPELRIAVRDFGRPLWRGEPIEGRTILLHAEQGLGDTLQFCRFVKEVAARGGRVVLEVQRPLVPLLAGLPGTVHTVARGDALPRFDLHCPILSLPAVLGTTLETIPPAPYITADPMLTAAWRRRLAVLPGLRVGVVWAGGPGIGTDHRRSMTLRHLSPLAALPGISLVSVQKGPAAAELHQSSALPLVDVAGELEDFADTAALLAALDLVISVDTSVAHLAGALGQPLWVLLRLNACWRWLRGREDSPWYPTAKLFRQTEPGEWDGVMARVGMALSEREDPRLQT